MDLNEYKYIKVSLSSNVFNIEQQILYTVKKIEKSNLYDFLCYSMLDNSPIYKLKVGVERYLKLNKLINNNSYINIIEDLFKNIKDNIEILPIFEES